ncbi:LysR family transcriptional regulator [Nocardia gipuzkoensis]|uniref:LysR family transcriptional regulator n=1 Tax=Nocardia gipuzkoensis TaxID=2749991 RepID=UPI00237EA823|nr:LysR family transcriptional regulator [Nocardia gipuzkoensis]MDE1673607.1 LysR family transcriptional regulator [Nocardia gipuzkoensis]
MDEFTVAGLRVVREAAACGSFSTAAENLGYTQSAVSRQIALMERAAGRALFERHARGVRPTEAGRIVLRHAEAILGELEHARHNIRHLAARPAGRLRIGAFSTATAALVPRAIAATAVRDRQLRISLREGLSPRLLAAVARERLDLAVVTAPETLPSGVAIEPLLDDPLLVAVASTHPLAGAASAPPDLLRAERWIAGSQEPAATLLGAWRDPGWEPDIAFVARDWFAKLGLVAAGLGITVVPGVAVPVLPPTIALLRIDHPAAVRRTVLAHGGDRATAGPRGVFAEALRDQAAELSAQVRQRLRGGG